MSTTHYKKLIMATKQMTAQAVFISLDLNILLISNDDIFHISVVKWTFLLGDGGGFEGVFFFLGL